MRRKKRNGVTRSRRILIALVVASVVALVLPERWTAYLISLVQIIRPLQDGAQATADAIEETLTSPIPSVSSEQYDALAREKVALENQTVSMAAQLFELEQQVEILTATRRWELDGARIGSDGALIPARVVAEDLLAWRSSRLVNAGSLRGARAGQPVTSHLLSVDQGEKEGVRTGMAVLLAEALVGHVASTGTHSASVQLVSDPKSEVKVRLGRLTDDEMQLLVPYFWLRGQGRGAMRIADAPRRDVEAGLIAIGDLVLSDHGPERLPVAMIIGTIADINPDRDNPLLSVLTIRSAVDESSLRAVYIYVPEAPLREAG